MPREDDDYDDDRDRDDDRDDDRSDRGRRRGAHYEEPHRGTMVLVLGILGLLICPLIGIAAWMMGSNDLKAMEEGRMDPEGKQLTQVGKILGIVSAVLLAIQIILILFYVVIIGVIIAAKG